MKIQQTKNFQYFITIPLDIIRLKGWRKGDNLHFIENRHGNIELKESTER